MKLSEFKAVKTLDPASTLKALEGRKDILSGPAQAQHTKLQGEVCPHCGTSLEIRLSPVPFAQNRPLPKYIGKCPKCKVDGIMLNA